MQFPHGCGYPPQDPIKKSKPVKIGQNRSKYANIYSKLAIFSWKRQQVDMFLATFVDHAIHC